MSSHVLDVVAPTAKEILIAEQSYRALFPYTHVTHIPTLKIIGKNHSKVDIPPSALRLLVDILEQMAAGHAVRVTSINPELTTQEAADLLNVSRPYLVTLLEQDKIPHRKVGTKRRVLAKDVLDYKEQIEKKRIATLEKLSAEAQKLKMGY